MWQKPIKKTIFLLNINNYAPELTALTYPFIERYAEKIGAGIHIIKERKYPDFPIVYEKLQVYELAQQMENDWNIYIDSDALIHPETIDFTELIPKDVVAQNGTDMGAIRWKSDRFFRRDKRYIGTCNWFTIFSDWCIELYKPIDDMTLPEILASIYPNVAEMNFGMELGHFVDDFVISRNLAKYGLKYTTLKQLEVAHGLPEASFFWHQYLISTDEKVRQIKEIIKKTWDLGKYIKE
jgi:hypothetical protein